MRMVLLVIAAQLAGCAVGPDFKQPGSPAASGYTPDKLPVQLVADRTGLNPAQRLVPDLDVQGDWWTLFHSQPLNDLITRSLKNNPDLAAAQASLKQARENVYAQEGSYFPNLTGSFTPSRNKTATGSLSPATASGNPYYSLYTAQLNVSYNPDVFGLNRRQTESLVALADVQRYQLEATYLTLTSNLVTAAITEASLRGQIQATETIITLEQGSVAIFRKQLAFGAVAGVDVLSQEAALAQAEASLPPLQKQLAQGRDMLTALAGNLSSDAIPETFTLDSLHLPEDLPVSLPSKLVEQRPDIKQAEQNLKSASALIGVAVANRLPLLNLSAFGGSQAIHFDELFTPGNGFWSIAASITQPLFDGGTLLHRERGARAAFEQAGGAIPQHHRGPRFRTSPTRSGRCRPMPEAVGVATRAAQTADAALAITREQLRPRANCLSRVCSNAEQTELQARLTQVQAQASRLADTAAAVSSARRRVVAP